MDVQIYYLTKSVQGFSFVPYPGQYIVIWLYNNSCLNKCHLSVLNLLNPTPHTHIVNHIISKNFIGLQLKHKISTSPHSFLHITDFCIESLNE